MPSHWLESANALQKPSHSLNGTVVLVLLGLITVGYIFKLSWVGVGNYTSPPHVEHREFQRSKTLWDWLQLLIIPLVLAVGGLWFTAQQNQTNLQVNQQQYQTNVKIATDQQQEATLETYLDRMSDLLINNQLRQTKPVDEVRNVARARTLTALRRLDGDRKAFVLQFLYQAQLINTPNSPSDHINPIISLVNADLSNITLGNDECYTAYPFSRIRERIGFILDGADLSGANLSEAKIHCVSLRGVSLSGTTLVGANLSDDDLSEVNLIGARLGCSIDEEICSDLLYDDFSGANLNSSLGSCVVDIPINVPSANRSNPDCGELSFDYLVGDNLSGMDLSNIDLEGNKVRKAKLTGPDLEGANLYGANLYGTNLYGTDLSGANLTTYPGDGSVFAANNLTQQQLDQVHSCKGATLPPRLTCHHNQ